MFSVFICVYIYNFYELWGEYMYMNIASIPFRCWDHMQNNRINPMSNFVRLHFADDDDCQSFFNLEIWIDFLITILFDYLFSWNMNIYFKLMTVQLSTHVPWEYMCRSASFHHWIWPLNVTHVCLVVQKIYVAVFLFTYISNVQIVNGMIYEIVYC